MKTSMYKDLLILIALVAVCVPTEAFGKDKEQKKEEPKTQKESADADDEVPESGVSFGVRAGYALPMGSVAKDQLLGGANDLSKQASGMIPLGVDLGYRLDPNWYIGAAFTFGFVSTSGDICNRLAPGIPGCSSSGTSIRIGPTIKYTFSPQAKLAPWVGVGAAYEVLNTSVTVANQSGDSTIKGWEYFNAQLGADYRVMPQATVGPMIGFSVGQYNSYSASRSNGFSQSGDFNQTALHHWVFIGLQGRYDL